jgi:hypothetical protein
MSARGPHVLDNILSSASPSAEATIFEFFFLYFRCLLVNPNYLGFRLFVCDGDPFFVVLALLSLFGFFGSQNRSKLSSLVYSSSLEVGLDLSL